MRKIETMNQMHDTLKTVYDTRIEVEGDVKNLDNEAEA